MTLGRMVELGLKGVAGLRVEVILRTALVAADIGVCSVDDLAVSLVSTAVGHRVDDAAPRLGAASRAVLPASRSRG